jgi:Domain of unknown function (DUF4598)
MCQRKRKLDFVLDAENKRRRSDGAESQQSPLSQATRPSNAAISDDHSASNYPRTMELESPISHQNGNSGSEDDSSESELSSDTETSSDSGISSSDSNDEEEDGASEHDSSIADTISDQHSLDDDSNIIATQPRPAISNSPTVSDISDLQSRIATFLPQLRKANEDLVNAEEDHRLDAVADDEDHYIEMDLGLGVLKEKAGPRPLDGEIWIRESSSSSSSDDDPKTEGPEEDAMRNLLGEKEKGRGQGRPVIQPLDEA